MKCDICGEEMKAYPFTDEAWGHVKTFYEYECTNRYCGEDEEDE